MSNSKKYTLSNGVAVECDRLGVGATVELESWSGQSFSCLLEDDSYIVFNSDGTIYDIAGNLETAINFTDATEGVAVYEVNREGGKQSLLDNEYALQCDLYGIESQRVEA